MKKLTKKAVLARIESFEGRPSKYDIKYDEARAWKGLTAKSVVERAEADFGWTAANWEETEPTVDEILKAWTEEPREPSQKVMTKPAKRVGKGGGKTKQAKPKSMADACDRAEAIINGESTFMENVSDILDAPPMEDDRPTETEPTDEDYPDERDVCPGIGIDVIETPAGEPTSATAVVEPKEIPAATNGKPTTLAPWDFSSKTPFPAQTRLKETCLDENFRTVDEIILAIGYTTDGADRKLKRSIADIKRSSPGGLILEERKRDKETEYKFRVAASPELAGVRAVAMVPAELAPIVARLPATHTQAVKDLLALVAKYS